MTDTEILQAIVRHRLMVDVVDGETTIHAVGFRASTVIHAEHGNALKATRHGIMQYVHAIEMDSAGAKQ